MKSITLVLLLLSTQLAFSTSYTSVQSGDFNADATWGGTGHPHAGDTWTIRNGNTVTCSGLCASGRATPSSCSVDGTVNAGGTLTVAAGGTLLHSGELDVQHSATVFEDNTLKQVVTVESVTDSTHLVLTSPGIPGMRQGQDTLSIYTSYWKHAGWYYGDSNNGSHDIHADPRFVDSTRSLCGWYKLNTGAPLWCPTYGSVMANPGVLVATSGTGGTTIHCAACNFTANGITTADVVQVYMGMGAALRGWSPIVAVTAQSLTLSSAIANLAAGDTFDFITSTQGLGKMMVQSAGFDWNGNTVTPPAWATAANAMAYVYAGFAPQNLIYHHAGDPADGFPDIGAVPVKLGR